MPTAINKQIHINVPAVFLGALIGVGFWMTIAAFAGALSMSIQYDDKNLPSVFALTAIAILAILILTSTFFFAGFIASRVAHQQLRFDSIIHSLATWAAMTILLVMLISLATATNGLRNVLGAIKPPSLVTDVQVFKAKATTTIEGGNDKKAKPTPAEMKVDKILTVVWWISFISLLLGSGASIFGGLIARRRLNL